MMMMAVAVVVITHQSVTVPRIFPVPVLFLGPIFSGTSSVITPKNGKFGTSTKFPEIFRYRYQYWYFFRTNFFLYRYRDFFAGPNISGTGTNQKGAKFPGPGCHTLLLMM